MSAWPHKAFGSLSDPVHKSHLNELTGEYGCPRRFKYQRDAEHAAAMLPSGTSPTEAKSTVVAHLACGTAAHETIARALNNPKVRDHLLRVDGAELAELDTRDKLESRVRATFSHELRVAADGRELDFGKESPEDMISERIDMIVGTLGTLCAYARRIIAVEPGFIVQLEGVWYSGHIDLVYVPRDGHDDDVGICDWKSGKQKPDVIELAHSWEAGIYSAACETGVFLPREAVELVPALNPDGSSSGEWIGRTVFGPEHNTMPERVNVVRGSRWQAERDGLETALKCIGGGAVHAQQYTISRYPTRAYHVHMRDFVPYEKAGAKEAKRAEDIAYYGLSGPGRVKYVAGHMRGPGWLPVTLHPNDVARLAYRSRNVIGTVRMGRFFDLVREHCNRCPFKADCLTGGYAPRGDDLVQLQTELKKAGL